MCLANLCRIALRVSLSVAIVAMVNQTALVKPEDQDLVEECSMGNTSVERSTGVESVSRIILNVGLTLASPGRD